MEIGGMPEYVLTEDQVYLSELLELIISKDIISKYNIKHKKLIYDLFLLLCERIGKQISYNKISKILGVDNQTISRYVGYFNDTYLFEIIEMEGKLNERILGKKKLYCIDVGLKNVITGFKDKGAIFENLVFNQIKKENPRFLYVDGIELDFVFKDTIIEAKYGQSLTEKQKELFDKLKYKNKIIAKDMDFFLN
jgi:predicted AAA+ superfamily ATPase